MAVFLAPRSSWPRQQMALASASLTKGDLIARLLTQQHVATPPGLGTVKQVLFSFDPAGTPGPLILDKHFHR